MEGSFDATPQSRERQKSPDALALHPPDFSLYFPPGSYQNTAVTAPLDGNATNTVHLNYYFIYSSIFSLFFKKNL